MKGSGRRAGVEAGGGGGGGGTVSERQSHVTQYSLVP